MKPKKMRDGETKERRECNVDVGRYDGGIITLTRLRSRKGKDDSDLHSAVKGGERTLSYNL